MVDGRNGVKYIYILLLVPLNLYIHHNEPCGQHYTLQPNTPIYFCIPDELGWTRGDVIYLWGYYPMIYSEVGLKHFNDVVWETRYE